MSGNTTIVMSAQYGGSDAGGAVRRLGNELKAIFKRLDGSYSDDIEKIKINLFVSGEITTFPAPSGWSDIRVMQKAGYVSFDITMQKDVWAAGDGAVWAFFREVMLDALKEVDVRMRQRGLTFDLQKAVDDVSLKVSKRSWSVARAGLDTPPPAATRPPRSRRFGMSPAGDG